MDLDDELRRLFQDDRLEIQVKPGADDAVVTGARRMRRRRVALASVASTFAVAAIVAGGVALSGITGATSMPPANSQVLTTTPTASAVWPVGYGPLKLVMSEQEAQATGVLVEPVAVRADGCRTYATDGNPNDPEAVFVSPTSGLVRVTVPGFATTGSGIGVGATVAEVRAKYPTVMEFDDHLRENMEGKQAWYYRFDLDDNKKVASIRMELTGNDCGLS